MLTNTSEEKKVRQVLRRNNNISFTKTAKTILFNLIKLSVKNSVIQIILKPQGGAMV